jgi:DNA repair protein RAD7
VRSLTGVPIAAKIKCGRCRKNLPQTKYSTKQLTDLRYQIKHQGRCTKAINCQPCTGNQVVEIECTMCHKTKGLEEFAKCQRNKPDTAVSKMMVDDAAYADIVAEMFQVYRRPSHSPTCRY